MKLIALTAALTVVLFAAPAAFAAEAASPLLAKVVVQAYMIRHGARTTSVEINANGAVSVTRVMTDGQTTTQDVAVLSPKVTAQIAADVKTVVDRQLVDTDPNQPACEDAPTTTYSVFIAGNEVTIAQRIRCKYRRLTDDTLEENALQAALDGARALAELTR